VPAATSTNETLFAEVVAAFAGDPQVEVPIDVGPARGKFGSRGLKVGGAIFAMLSKDRLVVKLPPARVAELVASKEGGKFVLGSRAMKEWVAFEAGTAARWTELAREARAFAGAVKPRGGRARP
jgi:hypothetical protein